MRISRDEQTILGLVVEKNSLIKQMNEDNIHSLYVDMNHSNRPELIYFGDDLPPSRQDTPIKQNKISAKAKQVSHQNGFSNNLFGVDLSVDKKTQSEENSNQREALRNDQNALTKQSIWLDNSHVTVSRVNSNNSNNPFRAFEDTSPKINTNPFKSVGETYNGGNEKTENISTLYGNHTRNVSSSSSENSFTEKLHGRPISRSVDNFINQSNEEEEETIYAEIVSSTDFSETTDVRKTRESDNPILGRFQKHTNLKRVSSMNSVNARSPFNGYYGTVSPSYTPEIRSRSMERPRRRYYENASVNGELGVTNGDIYQNTPALKNKRIIHRHSLHVFPEYIDEKYEIYDGTHVSHQQSRDNISKRHSFYENMFSTDDSFQENPKESSPMKIEKIMQSQRKSLIYTQIDISSPKSKSPPSVTDTSCSLASSPPESTCSSISSELSSAPPLPSARKSIHRMGSWSNFSYNPDQNYFPANYLGHQLVTKTSNEVIDISVSYVAEHTNLLEMRPVQAEITNDFVRFGTVSSPWEQIVHFSIEEIISFAVILKNTLFLGIITGKPGDEAYCHVLQADRCNEIADALSIALKSNSKPKIVRSQSSFEIRPAIIPPERQYFHSLVKVGIIKVKKSFLVVNDYISLILDKINPKEFKAVNLEITCSYVMVIDSKSERREESHPTSMILSIGVYEPDKRYFGYILSETASNSKTKFYCHVYRSARNMTALNIVDSLKAILRSKDYSSVRKTSNTEINPIYSQQNSVESITRNQQENERIPSVSTSGYSTASFLSNISSSQEFDIRSPSVTSDDVIRNQLGSTETLLTLTPGPNSSSDLIRSSDVITETRYQFEELTECIQEPPDPSSSPKYQQIESTQNIGKNEKTKTKSLFGKFKQSIRYKHRSSLTSQTQNIYSEPLDLSRVSMEPGLYHFNVSYICSTVISFPLKQKHVRDCYKQYIKEMNKVEKSTGQQRKLGSTVSLQIISKEGVSMLDPNQASCVIKGFTLDQYDSFIQHPEEPTCFAFSTKFIGNNKLKCHLFTCSEENPFLIEKAFYSMTFVKGDGLNNEEPEK